MLNSLSKQDEGLVFRDRFDFDYKEPGNQDADIWKAPLGIIKERV